MVVGLPKYLSIVAPSSDVFLSQRLQAAKDVSTRSLAALESKTDIAVHTCACPKAAGRFLSRREEVFMFKDRGLFALPCWLLNWERW